jgi:hypothetical protein
MKDYGDWALVTGASSGIGAAFARRFASEGLACCLVARRLDRLEELAEELRSRYDVEAAPLQADLSEPNATDDIALAVGSRQIGVLVNNAGFGYSGAFHEQDAQRLQKMLQVNCAAAAMLARRFLPGMVERRRGAVIMVSSLLGWMPSPYEALYGATKAFDLALGQALWAELKGAGVDVVTVCPGATKTEFFEVSGYDTGEAKRMMRLASTPEQIVNIALRGLGRKPAAAPAISAAPRFLSRFLPRSWTARLMMRSMEHIVKPERRVS